MYAAPPPRAKRLNELYYARDNQRSFPQMKAKQYHFRDEFDRLYYIREENDDLFQNERLRQQPGKGRCLVDSNGVITLDVKLRKGAEWFSEREVGKRILLLPRGKGSQPYLVRLETAFKYGVERRTGTVQVSGLDPLECNIIIRAQKNVGPKRVSSRS